MSGLVTQIPLSTAATVQSRWIDTRTVHSVTLQLSVTDVASPVGAITIEFSNDVGTIQKELNTGVLPANTTAARVDVTTALTVRGTALAAGYDGVGAKVSFTNFGDAVGVPAFFRVVYTKSSGGGATDILLVNVAGRD